MALTPKGKTFAAIAIGVVVLLGGWFAYNQGMFNTQKVTESSSVGNIGKFGTVSDNVTKVAEVPAPSKEVASISGPRFKMGQMQWESQLGSHLANGGPQTTKGSFMAEANINLEISLQNNCMAGVADIIKCANAYKSDPNTQEGLHMYNVMGDGVGAFLKGMEAQLQPLGSQYQPVIIPYFLGKSYGADAVWIPRTWTDQKEDGTFVVIKDSLKGSVISTVPKDGDWNIIVNLASINGLNMNWDIGTYDPTAINIHAVDDYQKAADACMANNGAGATEELSLKKGNALGKKVTVHVRGFSSWSPEDKEFAENTGGYVRVLSTKDYDNQMPCAIITFKKFVTDHRDDLVNMIIAFSKASDQIKSYPGALKKSAEIAVTVYNNMDASYYRGMYIGETVTDATGEKVEVGGNKVMNLADNMEFFGLTEGGSDIYQTVYNTYANIIAKNYPTDMPGGPIAYSKIVDKSLLQEAYDKSMNSGQQFITKAAVADFSKENVAGSVLGKANYPINFETGSDQFSSDAYPILDGILNNAMNSSNTRLEINGYTDDVGDNASNQTLSERRAAAVEAYFKKKAPALFKGYRVKSQGFGESNPTVPGVSEAARRANRRVEIVVKSNS